MKKKVISIILILVMLLLPFGILLDTNAEGIDIETDASGKVTNKGEIVVNGINAKKTEQGYDMTDSDTFKAYKVVDIYYNRQTNEISYRFTSDFQRFLDDSAYASDSTVHGLTIDDYLALTSDATYDISTGNATMNNISTTSTLNILASKYATFIRKNEDGANPVTGLPMTNSYDNDKKATLSNVVAGSYLVLPASVTARENYNDGLLSFNMYTYGVMVANVFFKAENGDWQLVNANINAKNRSNNPYNMLYPFSFEEAMNVDFESLTPEEQAILMANAGNRITASSGATIFGMFGRDGSLELPTNTHASVKDNNAIKQLLEVTEISLPAGLTFDYDNVHYADPSYTVTRDGNNFYLDDDDDELIASAIDQQNAISYMSVAFDILISNSYNFVAGANNTVNLKVYYLKDAYVDVGSNVTKDTVEAAFEKENTSEDTDQYKNIRKAIGVLNQELNVVLNGVRITNKDSNNVNLNGGVFQAYSDPNCTAGNEIGGPVTINNGVGSFVGINNFSTVYIKQITAPSGYKLYDKIIDLHPVATTNEPATGHEIQNVTLGADSYYEINVVNSPILSLPFTGGAGTIIYTVVGLVIVAGAITFIVLYRKKKKDK